MTTERKKSDLNQCSWGLPAPKPPRGQMGKEMTRHRPNLFGSCGYLGETLNEVSEKPFSSKISEYTP